MSTSLVSVNRCPTLIPGPTSGRFSPFFDTWVPGETLSASMMMLPCWEAHPASNAVAMIPTLNKDIFLDMIVLHVPGYRLARFKQKSWGFIRSLLGQPKSAITIHLINANAYCELVNMFCGIDKIVCFGKDSGAIINQQSHRMMANIITTEHMSG
jgi:hypothetical protein